MKRLLVLALWRLATVLCLVLGAVGIVLPVMPTVPFVLLAAACASRGWPQLERWLLEHARWGPPIRRWRERGVVPRRAKWAATLGMAGSATLLAWLPLHPALKLGVPAVMLAVAIWLWRRPEA